jgi:hypothetical protein
MKYRVTPFIRILRITKMKSEKNYNTKFCTVKAYELEKMLQPILSFLKT